MAEKSAIEWTDATFNPWWGCFPVSPGCALCYADREAARRGYSDLWEREGPRRVFGEAHWNEPRKWARRARKEGVRLRVFTASMGDIGDAHPICEQERPKLWRLIEETPELDWQLLTKRVDTARQWLPERWLVPGGWPAHAWFGFSAENQKCFDERWPFARQIPAAVRFCSYEPALGAIDFSAALWRPMRTADIPGWAMNDGCAEGLEPRGELHWIIAGGESCLPRHRARPANPDWFRSARDQAKAAGVAFLFKQWGEWGEPESIEKTGLAQHGWWEQDREDGGAPRHEWPGPVLRGVELAALRPEVFLVGKKAAGRLLDGREHNEFPESRP